MIWRLLRKIARLYTLVAIAAVGLMLASDKIAAHQMSDREALLALFFPWGVLAGLFISLFLMRVGGWITILCAAGFYLMTYWQSGIWSSNHRPLIIAGAAPLFLLAGFTRSAGQRLHKKTMRKKA